MTLDASLANLEAQANRLAGHFAAISDRIEADGDAFVANSYATRLNPAYFGPGAPDVTSRPVDHWDHEHNGYATPEVRQDTPPGVVATVDGSLLNYEGENYVPQTPQGPAPSSAPTTDAPSSGAVEVEGGGAAGAPAAPGPAANPFEAPAGTEVVDPPKKKGRRTHEELAADAGVDLADVKAWYGDGKKITKAVIEEYAASHAHQDAVQNAPTAPVHPQAVAADFVPEPAAPQPIPGVTDPSQYTQPQMPTVASDPFGGAPAAPPAPQQPIAGAYPGTNASPASQPAIVHQAPEFGAGATPQAYDNGGQLPAPGNPWAGQAEQPGAPVFTEFDPFGVNR